MNGPGRLRGYSFLLILSIETNQSRFTRPCMKVRIASLLPHKHIHYSNKLTINENCVGCGLCSKICPTQNISIVNLKAIGSDKCTMCYRCVSNCPQKAITILGKKVIEQYKLDDYI